MDYTKGPRCGVGSCPSNKYYELDGFTYCKRGHQREVGPATQPDEDDFLSQRARKTRQKKDVQETTSAIYSGRRALQLYLQSYQLILWKQCFTLIHTLGLPVELESVVKDLWALRLQVIKDKITEPDSSAVFSSQPETETEIESRIYSDKRDWKVEIKTASTLIESLGLCYLGMIVLRLPISLGEIHRWAATEQIPFIRAIRFVPKKMTDRLPAHYIKALDTQAPLKPDALRKSVHNLVIFYAHQFDFKFPALNHPLLLFKHIKDLALPLEIYSAVRSLSTLLSIDFSYPTSKTRQRRSNLPELQLMGFLVVAVKLYHPFDSLSRYARSHVDPAILVINWNSWCELQSKYDARLTSSEMIGHGNEMFVNEQDIMKMSDEQLDKYLDWYEKTWHSDVTREPKKGGLPKELLDMFPTGRPDGSSAEINVGKKGLQAEQTILDQKLRDVRASLERRDVVLEGQQTKTTAPIRRVGNFYKRYRKIEDLSPQARKFYEAAATLLGVSLSTMLMVVLQLESKLQAWRAEQVKAALEEPDNDEPITEGDSDVTDKKPFEDGMQNDVENHKGELDRYAPESD